MYRPLQKNSVRINGVRNFALSYKWIKFFGCKVSIQPRSVLSAHTSFYLKHLRISLLQNSGNPKNTGQCECILWFQMAYADNPRRTKSNSCCFPLTSTGSDANIHEHPHGRSARSRQTGYYNKNHVFNQSFWVWSRTLCNNADFVM